MTAGEKANHKEKVKKVMIDHLTALGFPAMESDQIMAQLKPMWLKIEEAGLVVEDMNFQSFTAYANHFYMIAQVNEIMGI